MKPNFHYGCSPIHTYSYLLTLIWDVLYLLNNWLLIHSKVELLSANGALQPENPCTGFNCSYSLTFNGPAYQCFEQPDFDIPYNKTITKEMLVPDGNYSYVALSSIEEDAYGRPLSWLNASQADIGALTEPDFWVGYVVNTSIPLPEPIVTEWGSVWRHQMDKKVLKCSMYTADQTFWLTWVNGVMKVENWLKSNYQLMTTWTPEETDRYKILT
jgi:hypothetical protein